MKFAHKQNSHFRVGVPLTLILVGASVVLCTGRSLGGDKAWTVVHAVPLAGAPPETTTSNMFEISSYELSKPGQGEQSSLTYTKQLVNALKKRGGWVSEVRGSDEDMFKTERDYCKGKSCDVVGVTETLAEGRMILTLDITSVPESHSKLHKARFTAEPHHCNPSNCSEETCRADLIEEIVEELAALDKDHKGSR